MTHPGVAQIAINERKGSIERGNTFEIRHEAKGGAALHYEERRNYEAACTLAAERCQEYGFAHYQTWCFTATPRVFCVSTIDVATGTIVEQHDVAC